MIKNLNSYPTGRNGKIHTHCRITIICDGCQKEWETQYYNYKRKKNKKDLCQSCKNKIGICGMKGKKHSDKTKNLFSKNRSKDKNSFWGKRHRPESIERMSNTRRGKVWRPPFTEKDKFVYADRMKKYWDGLTEEEKIARLANYDFSTMRKRLLLNGGKYSKLHQRVKNDMLSVGLKSFQSEEQVGRYVVDEVCYRSKIVIEINGDYWHANPSKYAADDVIVFPKEIVTAQSVWDSDKKRLASIKQEGYKIFTIWEYDVLKNNHHKTLKEIYGICNT